MRQDGFDPALRDRLRGKLLFLAGLRYAIPEAEAGGPVSVALDRWRQKASAADGLRELIGEFHLACAEYLRDHGGAWPAGLPDGTTAPLPDAPLADLLGREGSLALLDAIAMLSPEAREHLRGVLESRRADPPGERRA